MPAARSGAGTAPATSWDGPQEMLFLPPKNTAKEKWNGLRMSPSDPGIQARTGFASVLPFPEMRATLEKLAKLYPTIYTILPYEKENGGYPHEKEVVDWIHTSVPQTKLRDIRPNIEDLRQIKSPGEIAFLTQAIELSVDAQLAAMRMMRPGLHEYEIAAKMVEVHAMGGSEAEGYAPIVGAGPNSTALHYDKLARKIEDGDIVVLDVGAQYAGYSADITRTLPANGKFTPRQREIYEIVLGAQNAALAAVKPGMDYCQAAPRVSTKLPTTTSIPTAKIFTANRWASISFMASATTSVSTSTIPAIIANRSSQEWSSRSSPAFTFLKKISGCASRTTFSSPKPATNS